MSWKQKYDILENECLGKGNFGAVYLAKRKNEDTKICVKLIKQKKSFGKDVLETKALNEFEIANEIKGKQFQNLVNIYDVYQEDQNEYAYIFMEKCDGNISDYLKKNNQKTMSDTQIDEFINQISNGYCELSQKNIIHRDLKPENILYNLDVFGKPIFKIADFGLGKIISESSIDMTQSVGTPLYRAPEVINEQQYDNKCDLYSLGVIIFQMIVGEEKFIKEFIPLEIQNQLENKKFSQILKLPHISTFQQIYIDLLDSLINLNTNQRKSWQELTKWTQQDRPRNNTSNIKFQSTNQKQLKKSFTVNYDELLESIPPSGRLQTNIQYNQQNSNFQNVGSPLHNKFQPNSQILPDFNLQQKQQIQFVPQNNFPNNNQISQIQPVNFQTPQRLQTIFNNNQTQSQIQYQNVQPISNVQQPTRFQSNNPTQNLNQVQPNIQSNKRFQTQSGQQPSNPQQNNNFQNNLQRYDSLKNIQPQQTSSISNKQGFSNVKFFPQNNLNPMPVFQQNPISQQNQYPQSVFQQNPISQQNQNPQENNKNNNIDSASTSGQLSQEIGKQKEI